MENNTVNTKKSGMSEIRELTSDELNAVSGGYQLGGSHGDGDGGGFTQFGSATGGAAQAKSESAISGVDPGAGTRDRRS
jgi:hypothetical protein